MYPARRAVAVWRIQGRRLRVQCRLCEHIQRSAGQTNGVSGRGMTLMNVFHWQPGILRPQPGDLLVPPPRNRVYLAERIAHHGGGVEQVLSDASLRAGLRMVLEFARITAEHDRSIAEPLCETEGPRVRRPPLRHSLISRRCRHTFDPIQLPMLQWLPLCPPGPPSSSPA